ncbi:hypothetical protein [Roseateles depolymerans]|uniref:Uncharacterized protein n=1 Tax=Roseateles depolymerans TaxID=76731 RepID=A0A0U3MMV4_9BURK|nr:hypothetical protein [Roseateles depolymerans]ALV05642.1 hypothetical protein RD2015_1149 [Roseateles depolymerans]REG14339.1 hypothetical protein DES44_2830 [Roseateles depolymerans]
MTASLPQTQAPTHGSATDIDYVYQQLVKGVGRELVTDANAQELAERADQDGHTILATELREWQAPC